MVCRISPPAKRLTLSQSLGAMADAGHVRRTYFEWLQAQTNLTSTARTCSELQLTEREARCLDDGPVFVFGDSVGLDIARRLAFLRGVNVTSNQQEACDGAAVYWRPGWRSGGGLPNNYLPRPNRPLPEDDIPCPTRAWVWYAFGLHHLVRPTVLSIPSCEPDKNPPRVDGMSRATKANYFNQLYDGYPRCWDQFVKRLPRTPSGVPPSRLLARPQLSPSSCTVPSSGMVIGSSASDVLPGSSLKRVVTSILPPEAHLMLARPAKHDWGDFLDLGMAPIWLDAQRRQIRSGRTEGSFIFAGICHVCFE
jgi:hypothetical protein